MKIQEIVSDVRNRVGTVGRNYQDAFKAYFDAQRQAVGVVTKNGQTLANTEIGAAKNVFAAAKASFEKARKDGVRKVANNPQAYVPNGRDQIVSAYKDTIDLLVQTTNELSKVVTSGYKSVLGKLSGETKKASSTRKRAASTSRSTASSKKSTSAASAKTGASKTTAAKRKTASTRKSTANGSTAKAAAGTATTRKRSTAKKASAPAPSDASQATPGSTDSSAS